MGSYVELQGTFSRISGQQVSAFCWDVSLVKAGGLAVLHPPARATDTKAGVGLAWGITTSMEPPQQHLDLIDLENLSRTC